MNGSLESEVHLIAELRFRIFRLLEERQRERSGVPTAGQIADVLGEPLRSVVVTLRSSEAMGIVELAEGLGSGMEDADIAVYLKPHAYIYLEAHLNPE
jgi:DNA-binding transcriptional ArsR family regulator